MDGSGIIGFKISLILKQIWYMMEPNDVKRSITCID
jgi:hypothetical protein